LRAILAKLARTSNSDDATDICYVHRGAPNDQIRIRVSTISKLGKGWFCHSDGETQIPYHRVLWVRDVTTQRSYWEKRYPKPTSIRAP